MGGQILKFPDTEALKKSKNEGRVEGRIEERIDMLREENKNDDFIIANIRKRFGLTDEEARKYLAGGDTFSNIKEA